MAVWRKMLVLVALALIPIQIECLITCVMPSQTAAGCHHHRGGSGKQAPAPCAVGFLAGPAVPHANHYVPADLLAMPASQAAPAGHKPVVSGSAFAFRFSPPRSLIVLKV